MSGKTRLLKRVEGLELWTTISEDAEHFAVKTDPRRARVAQTLEEAESFLAARLHLNREARAH